ncbi:MAG: hypothetical protein E4G98_05430 [Promethearchaeota archaeon]|nr:MAG: hypothetical protein E4G98_05430 [Candidatus Lokiarchaeota archaeon]
MVSMENDLWITLFTGIYVLATVFIPKILKERGVISKFVARKLIHSFSGLAIFIAPYLKYPIIAGSLSLIMTIITRGSKKKSKTKPLRELFDAISEDEELESGYLQGPFSYCLGITILMLIFIPFADKYFFPITSILIMMFADSAAAIVGRKYGTHHITIPWVGSKRTVEGSLTFLLVALILSFLSFGFFGYILPGNSMILNLEQIFIFSVSLSLISTGLELLSPSKYDDLIIPLGSTLLISLLAIILKIW